MKQKLILLIALVAALVQPVFAGIDNTTISTTIINTQYLDLTIWILIVLLGFGFLILSNIRAQWNSQSSQALWALIAPFFLFPAAYFTLQIQTMSYVPTLDAEGAVHVAIQQTVYHPEWLALVLGIMFLFSIINFFYIITRKAVVKPSRSELTTGVDTDY
jgi:hypothetical protein